MLIVNGAIYCPEGVIQNGMILVDGSTIGGLWGPDDADIGASLQVNHETIDATGYIVLPGFIDLQANGAGGKLFSDDPSVDTLITMSEVLAKFGCTSFLPTMTSSLSPTLLQGLQAVRQTVTGLAANGSEVLGIHLEGPFLNPRMTGAHPLDSVRPVSITEFQGWCAEGESLIKVLTLAPEISDASELIRTASRMGITVALGHTDATYDQAVEGISLGATLVTHLFNAMGRIASRAPGAAGAFLVDDRVSVSLIPDGLHVHPELLKLAVRTKGVDKAILITDSMPPVGTTSESFWFGGEHVLVKDGVCVNRNGVIAGSILTMDRAVKNIESYTGVSLHQAVKMATINPAKAIGIDPIKGSIEIGKHADLIVCDHEVNVLLTMVKGRVIYRSAKLN